MQAKTPQPTPAVAPLVLGDVAFMTVTEKTGTGALVDAGFGQRLVVAKQDQTWDVDIGARYVFGLVEDERGGIKATMRVAEMLHEVGSYRPGEWVNGEVWHDEPGLGLFVILGRRHVGLLPIEEPQRLTEGAFAEFRIARVLPDGKPVLSLRGLAHEEIQSDADLVLSILTRPSAPNISERASPTEIRALFGLSKKAFKRAVGYLLKNGKLTIENDQIVVRRVLPRS